MFMPHAANTPVKVANNDGRSFVTKRELIPVSTAFEIYLHRIEAELLRHFHMRHHLFGGMNQQISLRKSLHEIPELGANHGSQAAQASQFFCAHIAVNAMVGTSVQVVCRANVELPNAFRLPGRERLRIHRFDIGVSQQAQHFQALLRAYFLGESGHRLRIKNIAPQLS